MSKPHRLASINLNLLVALDALLATGSVTRAARLSGVSQSAMSQSLAQLRRRDPRVAADGDGPGAEEARGGPPDAVCVVGRQLVGHHPPDVVGLEDRHGGGF